MRINSKIKAGVLAVAMAALPTASWAAGLGRLNVLSGLGQPLRAEIDLVSVTPQEVESLRAGLAPTEAFRDAQIEYPSSSLGLRFSLEKRPSGQYFIAVNSSQSINEPFLDFLVELKWNGGKVLREYTALLDPVGYAPSRAPQGGVSIARPVEPTATKSAVPVKAPPASAPAAVDGRGSEYTTQSGDTLLSVAQRNKVEGVSLEQMLVGIFRANPDAFDGKNMNRLRKGHTLHIPDKAALEQVTSAEAVKEIRVHADNWRAYRGKLADAASSTRPVEQPSAGSGKIVAKVNDKAAAAQPAAKDTLKLSKGDESEAKSLKQKIQLLEEQSAADKKALNEANQRVAELEKNIKKMEELLALKSKQGAAAQAQAEAAKPSPVPESKPAAQAATEPVKPQTLPEAKSAEAPHAEAAHDASVAPNAAQPPAAKPKPKAQPLPPPPPEEVPGFLEENLPLLAGGGLFAALLAGGGIWFARRRRKASFEDSIITGSDLKSNTVVGNTGGAVISTGVTENSFLTDFSREGLGTIDTDEVDPVAEAEVYMAYGRDAQAEEILKDALARDTNRPEVRLKLMEIYSGRKNLAAFEAQAQALYTLTQGSGPVWQQGAEMGRALDPQNPLYQQQVPVDTNRLDQTVVMSVGTLGTADATLAQTTRLDEPLVEGEASSSATQDAPSFDAGDLDFSLDAVADPTPEVVPESMDFDLDLGLDTGQSPAAEPATAAAVPPAETLDFDLGDFGVTPESRPETTVASAAETAPDGMLSLDMPIDLGSALVETPAALDVAPASIPGDLPAFDLDRPAETSAVELQTTDFESAGGLDFDFDAPAVAAAATPTPEFTLDGLNLDLAAPIGDASGLDFGEGVEDPIATKIDLARAYIEMGDKEGAREILQDAIGEGTSDQRATAESLLAQL